MGRTAGWQGGVRWAAVAGALGIALLILAGVVAFTGGFDFRIGRLVVRSHAWRRPAIAGLVLVVVALFLRRHEVRPVIGRVGATLSAAAVSKGLALAALAWTIAASSLFSTCSAGGADSSGYLSQARLFAQGQLTGDDGVGERPPWPDPDLSLAPLGYKPTPDRARLAPTYPPGLPLLMAPGFFLHPDAPYIVVPLCGAAMVGLTFLLGARLGHRLAAAVAALLVSVSPTFLYQVIQPMSDVPVAALWLLALYLALGATPGTAAAAGIAAGLAILVRPNLAPLVALVSALAAIHARRAGWQRAALVLAAAAPAVVVLGIIQDVRYGSPFASGYGTFDSLFSLAHVRPNLERYPRWMVETHTPLIWLWLIAPVWLLRRGRPAAADAPVRLRATALVFWLFAVAVVLAYLPYIYFQPQEWMYTRFLLPAIPLMWLLGLMPIADAIRRPGRIVASAAGVAALAAMVLFSVRVAAARSTFLLTEGEAKYVRAGRFVESYLPRNAIVISMQHSGSVRFYSGRPILRWDFIDRNWLDRTVEWLRDTGFAPYAVLDTREMDDMQQRFGTRGRRTLDSMKPIAQFAETVVYELR